LSTDSEKFGIGLILGAASVALWEIVIADKVKVFHKDKRVHHGRAGFEFMKSKDPFTRGVGLVLAIADIKDVGQWFE